MNECVYGGDESLTPGHVTGLTHTHTHTVAVAHTALLDGVAVATFVA